jgi:hypothetical protein
LKWSFNILFFIGVSCIVPHAENNELKLELNHMNIKLTCRLPEKDLQFNFGFLELGYLDDEFFCRISASCRRRQNLTISISLLHLNLVE